MSFGFWQDFYYPLGLSELKIFFEKEMAWYLCNRGLKPERSEEGWTELREQGVFIWIKMYLTPLFVIFEKKI